MRMHADQHDIDVFTVRQLVADQFPQWADEPVTPVESDGTVNAIFRIGGGLVGRFPLQGTAAALLASLRAEASAIDEFAACAPVPAPRHVALGHPGEGFGLPWSVQTWVEGEPATPVSVADSSAFAGDLARLIRALRAADVRGRRYGGAGRGGDLRGQDAWIAECIRESADIYDASEVTALWAEFRDLPREGQDVMTHGDLVPSNVLVRSGRLAGVLDTGGFGAADPALDLVCAWHLLETDARAALRAELAVGDLEWLRGAAWAFAQAMGLAWYYRDSNPVAAQLGRTTMGRLLREAPLLTGR